MATSCCPRSGTNPSPEPDLDQRIKLRPLLKKPPSFLKSFITNGTGKIVREYKTLAIADVDGFPIVKVVIPYNMLFVDGERTDASIPQQRVGQPVNFDADYALPTQVPPFSLPPEVLGTTQTFIAVLAWQGGRPLPQKLMKKAEVPETKFDTGVFYIGAAEEVLPGHCVVNVDDVHIYALPDSMIVDPWTKNTFPSLVSPMDYLESGDTIVVSCKWNGHCFQAEKLGCGSVRRTSLSSEDITGPVLPTDCVRETIGVYRVLTKLQCTDAIKLDPDALHEGVVVEIPFGNYAIAVIGVIRVLISLSSITGAKDDEPISKYLEIGCPVVLWVSRVALGKRIYYKAIETQRNPKINEDCACAVFNADSAIHNISGVVINSNLNNECLIRYFESELNQTVNCKFQWLRGPEVMSGKYREQGLLAISSINKILRKNPSVKITFIISARIPYLKTAWLLPDES